MGDLAIVGKVSEVHVELCEIRAQIMGETVTVGQAGYVAATGKVGVASAAAAGKEQFRGIILDARANGQAGDVLSRGFVTGFDLSGLAYDAPVFLSDTPGKLSTSAGTKAVTVGRVVAETDSELTKVLFVEAAQLKQW